MAPFRLVLPVLTLLCVAAVQAHRIVTDDEAFTPLYSQRIIPGDDQVLLNSTAQRKLQGGTILQTCGQFCNDANFPCGTKCPDCRKVINLPTVRATCQKAWKQCSEICDASNPCNPAVTGCPVCRKLFDIVTVKPTCQKYIACQQPCTADAHCHPTCPACRLGPNGAAAGKFCLKKLVACKAKCSVDEECPNNCPDCRVGPQGAAAGKFCLPKLIPCGKACTPINNLCDPNQCPACVKVPGAINVFTCQSQVVGCEQECNNIGKLCSPISTCPTCRAKAGTNTRTCQTPFAKCTEPCSVDVPCGPNTGCTCTPQTGGESKCMPKVVGCDEVCNGLSLVCKEGSDCPICKNKPGTTSRTCQQRACNDPCDTVDQSCGTTCECRKDPSTGVANRLKCLPKIPPKVDCGQACSVAGQCPTSCPVCNLLPGGTQSVCRKANAACGERCDASMPCAANSGCPCAPGTDGISICQRKVVGCGEVCNDSSLVCGSSDCICKLGLVRGVKQCLKRVCGDPCDKIGDPCGDCECNKDPKDATKLTCQPKVTVVDGGAVCDGTSTVCKVESTCQFCRNSAVVPGAKTCQGPTCGNPCTTFGEVCDSNTRPATGASCVCKFNSVKKLFCQKLTCGDTCNDTNKKCDVSSSCPVCTTGPNGQFCGPRTK